MRIELITGLLFLALGILFLLGKGSFLIAGYNTSSKAEKAKYDEKKICRYAGIAMLIASIGQFVLLWNKNLMWLTLLVSFIAVAVAIVGTNFFSKKKVEDINETEIKPYDNNASKIVKIGSLVFTLIILAGAGGLLFAGDVSVSVGKNAVEVNAFICFHGISQPFRLRGNMFFAILLIKQFNPATTYSYIDNTYLNIIRQPFHQRTPEIIGRC